MGYIEKGRAKTFTKIILWMVVISFVAAIFVTWGAQRSGIQMGSASVLNVGGVDMSPNDIIFYGNFYRYVLQRVVPASLESETRAWWIAAMSLGNSLAGFVHQYQEDTRYDYLSQGVMLIVGDTVLARRAAAAGIRISDRQITKLLANIYTDSEGKFLGERELENELQFFQIGSDQSRVFKESLRRHLMAREYVSALFASMQPALETDMLEMYKSQNLNVSFSYTEFKALDYLDEIEYQTEDLRTYLAGHQGEFVIADMIAVDQTLFAEYLKSPEGQLSEEEISAYYDENKSDYAEPESRDIRRILIKLPQDADEETEAAAQEKIDEIYNRLQRPGEEFATVARIYSEDEVARGEDNVIRELTLDSARDEAFITAVFDLNEVGDFNEEAVRTEDGLEIIQLVNITPEQVKPLDDVRAEIIDALAEEKAEDEAEAKCTELRTRALNEDWQELSSLPYVNYFAEVVAIEGEDQIFTIDVGLVERGELMDIEELLKTESGKITEILDFGDNYAFFRVRAAGSALEERFDFLTPALIRRYTKVESLKAAKAKAEEFSEQITDVATTDEFKAAAEESGLEAKDESTNRWGFLQYGQELIDQAFEADPPALIGPVERGESYYVLLVTGKTEFKQNDFDLQAPSLRQRLLSSWLNGQPIFIPGREIGATNFAQLLEAQIAYLVKTTEVQVNRDILSAMFGGGGN